MASADLTADLDTSGLTGRVWFSYLVVAVLVFGLGSWATFTPIAGAVIAGGTIVVESNPKRVQHQEGGIVAQILARNEDHVEAGAPLLKLDDTMMRASLAVVNNQLDEALAIEARLVAETTGADDLVISSALASRIDDPEIASLLEAHRGMMRARTAVRVGAIAQLEEQIAQLRSQIEGHGVQRVAVGQQLEVVGKEFSGLQGLLDAQLVPVARVNDLTREKARLEGEIGTIETAIAGAEATIAERQVMISQVDATFLSDALAELQELREKIAQLMQQKIAGEDRLSRITIVAPQSGIVHQSIVHTIGGVVGPGETLMSIVPVDDTLVVEVRINPLDVDKVTVGQAVIVRIPGLNARTTPDLRAHVTQIAPDLTTDPQTGIRYFAARVAFEQDALSVLPSGQHLTPGMPADAYIQTGERTVLTYLMQPLVEQFYRVMRED